MEKVKWGVLGTANIARGCTIPGMKLANNCELYAIAGRNPEKAEAFQRTAEQAKRVAEAVQPDAPKTRQDEANETVKRLNEAADQAAAVSANPEKAERFKQVAE